MHCLEIAFVTGVILVCLTNNDAINSPPMKRKALSMRYESCNDILNKLPSVKGKDGVYEINLDDQKKKVFCDMTTEGGGWTVIQKKVDKTDFYKKWEEYKNGFGDPCNSYWIGNDAIHTLTKKNDQVLWVQLQSLDCDQFYAKYTTFHVGNAASKYKLTVSGPSGTADDIMEYDDGQTFTTYDQDNRIDSGDNCAVIRHGAWWHGSCLTLDLNVEDTMWTTEDSDRALKGTLMMVRTNE